MSSDADLLAATHAEWIKFRTIRSSIMGVVVTAVLTVGIGVLICALTRSHWSQISALRDDVFDPVSRSLGGTLFAQFAVGVIGTLFITSEYTSGSISTTLAAVPNRLRLVASKLIVLTTSMVVVSEVLCFAAFLIGQRIFLGVVPTASLATGSVLRSVILAGVYLTLLSIIGFALGVILRQSSASISVFVSLLLILPIIGLLLPQSWQNAFTKFEPSSLGQSMQSPTTAVNTFSAWNATLLLVIYTVALVVLATVLFERRDAGSRQ